MFFFQAIRTFYQRLGVCSPQYDQTYSCNSRIVFVYLTIIMVFMSETAYCVFEAHSIIDYGKSFYAFTMRITVFWEFLTTIWQMSNILNLMGQYELFIEKSKCDSKIVMNFQMARKMIRFFSRAYRTAPWIGNIHWTERTHWTNVEIDGIHHAEIYVRWICDSRFAHWFCEFLYFQFGRRIISKRCTIDVRNQHFPSLMTRYLNWFLLMSGCHSVGKRPSDMCVWRFFNWDPFARPHFVAYRV